MQELAVNPYQFFWFGISIYVLTKLSKNSTSELNSIIKGLVLLF